MYSICAQWDRNVFFSINNIYIIIVYQYRYKIMTQCHYFVHIFVNRNFMLPDHKRTIKFIQILFLNTWKILECKNIEIIIVRSNHLRWVLSKKSTRNKTYEQSEHGKSLPISIVYFTMCRINSFEIIIIFNSLCAFQHLYSQLQMHECVSIKIPII
jgi:hypothetical protein